MEFKKLQKWIDKGIVVLSDNDDKKNEERYIKLQEAIEESQDFVEKNNYSLDIDEELRKELKVRIDAFKEEKIIFIIFLIILCGLLFVGVFYITYSHFYDHWYHGGHFIPPHHHTTKKPHKTEDKDKTTSQTDKTTTSTQKTTSYHENTSTTTKPVEDGETNAGFVTVLFDNSNLIDLENIYPVLDSDGIKSKPTTWKLSSTLDQGSKDYIVRYAINFIDNINDIPSESLLDLSNLKFNLIVKHNNSIRYNSGIQELDDYPEVKSSSGELKRPIITLEEAGNTFRKDETLDFELRMWLDSATGNSEQGKKYRFNIDVEAEYAFID